MKSGFSDAILNGSGGKEIEGCEDDTPGCIKMNCFFRY